MAVTRVTPSRPTRRPINTSREEASVQEPQAYGLRSSVILNLVLFTFFALTFFKPSTARDWHSFGAFSAFLVALFTEIRSPAPCSPAPFAPGEAGRI
jgi:hypothetical protein